MSSYCMVPVHEAAAIVAKSTPSPRTAQLVQLNMAKGRILAEDVYLEEPIPRHPTSIKDGYAVLASDGPGEYILVGASRAGVDDGGCMLSPGSVAYITTGAPLPAGADAVVEAEKAHVLADARVRIGVAVAPGTDVREVGADASAGEALLMQGDLLGDAEIGVLAMAGRHHVLVCPQPVVGILSTGSELVETSVDVGSLARGSVRDANRSMLLAAAADLAAGGARVVDLGIVRDEPGSVEAALLGAAQRGLSDDPLDVVVTTGGVSMGDRDFVKPLLERCGKIHFGRLMMKPGKPTTFATMPRGVATSPSATFDPPTAPAPGPDSDRLPQQRRCAQEAQQQQRRPLLVFALPGNPCSAFVTFHLLVAPTLRRLAGWRHPEPRRVQCRLLQPLRLDPVRPEYHRARLFWSPSGGGLVAASTGIQRSSRLLSLRHANALLELPNATTATSASVSATGTTATGLPAVLPANTLVSALIVGDLRASLVKAPFVVPCSAP